MTDDDKLKFAEVFTASCFTYGKDVSKEAMRLYWRALDAYTMDRVDRAFQKRLRIGRYFPTIADLIALLDADHPGMERPGPDEAWAMIPKDEESSAVLTDEMLGAYSVAAALIHEGDMIAGRMAFKDAYSRLCATAKASGKPVRWVISRGWDRESLGSVVSEAVRIGRISPEEAAPILGEIEYHAPMVAGLLEGTKNTANEEKAKAFLAQLRQSLKSTEPTVDMEAIRAEVEEKDRKLEEGGHGKFA